MTNSTSARSPRSTLRRAAGTATLAGAVMAPIGFVASAAASVAPTTIGRGAPIISVSNVQADGTIWVLAGRGHNRTMTKVDVASGAFVTSESVSPQASAIAQSPNGEVALGTSNGPSSAVILYGGATGNYLGTVRVSGPVTALAMSPNGTKVYALEATKPNRTLFVFDQTHQGFPYQVGGDAVDVAPLNGGADIWILHADGTLAEMSFFPNEVVKSVSVGARAKSLAVSPDGNTLYVLAGAAGKAKQLSTFSPSGARLTGSVALPKGASDLALSVSGTTIYAAESGTRSGIVAAIPAKG